MMPFFCSPSTTRYPPPFTDHWPLFGATCPFCRPQPLSPCDIIAIERALGGGRALFRTDADGSGFEEPNHPVRRACFLALDIIERQRWSGAHGRESSCSTGFPLPGRTPDRRRPAIGSPVHLETAPREHLRLAHPERTLPQREDG